jgi:hypothetical protein
VRRAVLLIALLACVLAAASCGSDRKDRPRPGPGPRDVDPVPAEDVDDAIDRTRGAATASGCEAVKGLLHYSYPEVSGIACDAVKSSIDGFRDPRGKAYKTGAAVDYTTTAGGRRVMALALDPDRTYKVAFVENVPEATLDTAKPPLFDSNAQAVVQAMKTGDCDAFLRLVSRSKGLGVGPDREVCGRVSDVPWRRQLVANPAARPVPLGGNGWVAFYKLRTARDAYYTLVMERERGPGGRPRYVLVNAFAAQ